MHGSNNTSKEGGVTHHSFSTKRSPREAFGSVPEAFFLHWWSLHKKCQPKFWKSKSYRNPPWQNPSNGHLPQGTATTTTIAPKTPFLHYRAPSNHPKVASEVRQSQITENQATRMKTKEWHSSIPKRRSSTYQKKMIWLHLCMPTEHPSSRHRRRQSLELVATILELY